MASKGPGKRASRSTPDSCVQVLDVDKSGGGSSSLSSSSSCSRPAGAHQGVGRGLFLTRSVKAGETVLIDDPVLIYVDEGNKKHTCANCFRMPGGTGMELPHRCEVCNEAWFCGEECKSGASKCDAGSGHSAQECQLLKRFSEGRARFNEDAEAPTMVRMLIKAALMKAHDAKGWPELEKLRAPVVPTNQDSQSWQGLCKSFVDLGGECKELGEAAAMEMLWRDASNSMGIQSKRAEGEDLSLRAACIYGPASMMNHACYPNVARFDYFDRDGPENLKVHFRALTDLEAGAELRMNYLSILVEEDERRERLRDEYGFECKCERCHLEKLFGDDDGDDDEASKCPITGLSNKVDQRTEQEEDEYNALALWMAKYSCPDEDCGGTMAPVREDDEDSSRRSKASSAGASSAGAGGGEIVMECNRCGQIVQGLDRVYQMLESDGED